jgi:integrase
VNESYIHSIIDELRNTPSAANHAVAVIRTLFRFALKRRIVSKDPTTGAGRLKGGDGYARWPDAAIATFLASASPAMRLALYLGLYTGQRLSDVIAMRWEAYDGKRIKLRQQKTGTPLVIPVHPDLRALLDPIRREAGPVLTSKTGLPFHSRVFSRDFRDARIAAGLPEGLSFHGLRHTAASRLAEVGATAPEIQAITGHKSLKLVEHYIRQADQELQAERAISRIPTREK